MFSECLLLRISPVCLGERRDVCGECFYFGLLPTLVAYNANSMNTEGAVFVGYIVFAFMLNWIGMNLNISNKHTTISVQKALSEYMHHIKYAQHFILPPPTLKSVGIMLYPLFKNLS